MLERDKQIEDAYKNKRGNDPFSVLTLGNNDGGDADSKGASESSYPAPKKKKAIKYPKKPEGKRSVDASSNSDVSNSTESVEAPKPRPKPKKTQKNKSSSGKSKTTKDTYAAEPSLFQPSPDTSGGRKKTTNSKPKTKSKKHRDHKSSVQREETLVKSNSSDASADDAGIEKLSSSSTYSSLSS